MSEYKKVLESVEGNKKVLELMEKYKGSLGSASENLEGTRA